MKTLMKKFALAQRYLFPGDGRIITQQSDGLQGLVHGGEPAGSCRWSVGFLRSQQVHAVGLRVLLESYWTLNSDCTVISL